VSVKMSEREIQDLQLEDIAPRKNSQLQRRNPLGQQAQTLGQAPAKPYNPTSAKTFLPHLEKA